MADGTKLASGFIELTVKAGDAMKDITASITGLGKDAEKAGKQAGDALNKSLSKGAKDAGKSISDELAKAAKQAGSDAGDAIGKGVSKGAKDAGKAVGDELKSATKKAGEDAGSSISDGVSKGADDAGTSLVDRLKEAVQKAKEQVEHNKIEPKVDTKDAEAKLTGFKSVIDGLAHAAGGQSGKWLGETFAGSSWGHALQPAIDGMRDFSGALDKIKQKDALGPLKGQLKDITGFLGETNASALEGVLDNVAAKAGPIGKVATSLSTVIGLLGDSTVNSQLENALNGNWKSTLGVLGSGAVIGGEIAGPVGALGGTIVAGGSIIGKAMDDHEKFKASMPKVPPPPTTKQQGDALNQLFTLPTPGGPAVPTPAGPPSPFAPLPGGGRLPYAPPANMGVNQAAVYKAYQDAGFAPQDFPKVDYIIRHESNYDTNATNPATGDWGIPQFNPAAGNIQHYLPNRSQDPYVQGTAMMSYIRDRYGNPGAAYDFKQTHGWYAKGGVAGVDSKGRLFGPGTGTSDSILGIDPNGTPTAMVSNGEGIVRHSAMQQGADRIVAALNSGVDPGAMMRGLLPGFAQGTPAPLAGVIGSGDHQLQWTNGADSRPPDWMIPTLPRPDKPERPGPGLSPGDFGWPLSPNIGAWIDKAGGWQTQFPWHGWPNEPYVPLDPDSTQNRKKIKHFDDGGVVPPKGETVKMGSQQPAILPPAVQQQLAAAQGAIAPAPANPPLNMGDDPATLAAAGAPGGIGDRTQGYIPAGAGASGQSGTSLFSGALGLGAQAINGLIDQAGSAAATAIGAAATAGSFGAGGEAAGPAASFAIGIGTKAAERGVSYGFQLAGIGADALTEILSPFGVPRFFQTDPTQFIPHIGVQPTATTTGEKASLQGDQKAQGETPNPSLSPSGPVQPGQLAGAQPIGAPVQMAKPTGVAAAPVPIGAAPTPTSPAVPNPVPPAAPSTPQSGPQAGQQPQQQPSGLPLPFTDFLGGLAKGGVVGVFDQGGILQPGAIAINRSTRPEPVFNSDQWATMTALATQQVSAPDPAANGSGGNDYSVHFHDTTVKDVDELMAKADSQRRLQMMRYAGRP